MQRKVGLIAMLVVALLAVPSVALAQGGGGDRIVVAQQYVLRSGETQDGNLAVVAGSAVLESGSVVNGDVAVLGGSLRAGGTVRGSLAVFAGSVTLDSGAVIQGDLATFGGSVQRDAGAVINGEVFNAFGSWQGGLPTPPRTPEIPVPPAIEVPGFPDTLAPRVSPPRLGGLIGWQLGTLGWMLTLVLLAIVALVVAPKAIAQVATTAAGEPGLSLGVGLLTWAVALVAGAVLLICCGLGLLVWLVLLLALLVGWVAVGLWVGQRVLQALKLRESSSLGEVALGVALITVAARLPVCIGFLFFVLVGSIGLGAVVLTRFGTQPTTTSRLPLGAAPDAGGGEAAEAAPTPDDTLLLDAPVVLEESPGAPSGEAEPMPGLPAPDAAPDASASEPESPAVER